LQGTLGDVTVRRQAFPTLGGISPPADVAEKVAATRDAARSGFWIIFHEYTSGAAGTNAFYAYHLSAAGIDNVNVSNVGTPIVNGGSGLRARGEMKISPDGTLLATANEEQVSELFRFNNSTGAVSLIVTLDANQEHYGVSFSPNSRLLYINTGWGLTNPSTNIFQYNLASLAPAAITASRVQVGTSSDGSLGGMQIAPDGRIYITKNGSTSLGAINCPDVAGVGCTYIDKAFTFTGSRSGSWGLPNLILESVATPSFAGPTDTSICIGSSVRIGIAARPGYTYSWTPGGTLSSTTAADPIASPASTTIYQVTATNPFGCTTIDNVTVTVNPLPQIVKSNDTTICAGQSTPLTASGGATFRWSPATGLSDPNIANPVASPSATTTYNVTVTNASGCSDSAKVTVTVNPLPVVDAGSPVSICSGKSVRIGSAPVAGLTYSWSPPTGLDNANIANPTVTLSAPGPVTYTVTVTNASNCVDSDKVVVTVNANPVASAGRDSALCAGSSLQLGSPPTAGLTYLWTPPAGLSNPAIANPIATPAATTTYMVTVTNASGCIDSGKVTLTVNPRPVATVLPADTICAGRGKKITASGGTIYRWSPPTGLSDPNIPDPVVSPLTTTTYRVVVENQFGCLDSANVAVTVVTPRIILSVPDTVGDPHTHDYHIPIGIQIPIQIGSAQASFPCVPDSLTVELEFNASLFFPKSVTRGRITRNEVVNGRRVIAISFDAGTPIDASSVLTDLVGDVLLGDSTSTPILFRSIDWKGLIVNSDSIDGSLGLLPYCLSGGARLLDFATGFGVTKVAPNPGSGEIVVEVRTVELGETRLEVYSSSGQRVYVTGWTAESSASTGGEGRRIILPADMPSGVYQVMLVTPARRDTKTLIITR
jgi:hypothetical protein